MKKVTRARWLVAAILATLVLVALAVAWGIERSGSTPVQDYHSRAGCQRDDRSEADPTAGYNQSYGNDREPHRGDRILSPTLPGINTLTLTLPALPNGVPAGAPLRLSITMPGMAMPPIKAELVPRGIEYSGAVRLPMFGYYKASLVLGSGSRHYSGSMALVLTF